MTVDGTTPVTSLIAYRAIGSMVAGVVVLIVSMWANDKNVAIVLGTVFGVAASLIPIALRIRRSPPATMTDIYAVSRESTKTCVLWLGMMALYAFARAPMGVEILYFGVTACVTGLVASRIVFPAITIFLVTFDPPRKNVDSHE